MKLNIVYFKEIIPLNFAIEKIACKNGCQIIVWYSGVNGLNKESVCFYREKIFNPIKTKVKCTFWLLDLCAWKAFTYPGFDISNKDENIQKISFFKSTFLEVIYSSEIFHRMNALKSKKKNRFLEKVLEKKSIYRKSSYFKNSNIILNDIFKNGFNFLSKIKSMDSNKAYSAIQYLEIFFIIEKILSRSTKKNVKLIFLLPNDEIEFYFLENNRFNKDLKCFLNLYGFKNKFNSLKIEFISFEFGKKLIHRPYSNPRNSMIENELKIEDVIGT